MHILFCTAAKHLFGIKMCTSVSSFFVFKYYYLGLHCLLNIFLQRLWFNKEPGDNCAFPLIKRLILVECQEFLETKLEN